MLLKKFSFIAFLALVVTMVGCENGASQSGGAGLSSLETRSDSVSYSFGVDIANSFKTQGWAIDGNAMMAGFNAVTNGETPMLSNDQCRQIIMNYQREEQASKQAEEGSANVAAGESFRAQYKGNPGVKELPSGLLYETMTEGKAGGPNPTLDDQVRIHYKGTLIDGTTFDSSYDRGEPAVFQPRGLIKAWQEILPMMKPGDKFKIVSPPELAYGEFGSPPRIGPNATLVFEMELFEVIKQ